MSWLTSRIVQPRSAELAEALEALLLEEHVTDGQRLVHDVDVGLEVGEEREGEADEHAGGVLLDGPVDELADLGEVEDGGQAVAHLGPGKPSRRALSKMFCRPVSSG